MVRIKRGNVARKRRKKILTLASGYRGAHSVLFRVANQQVMKALRYSYIGRKQKKRIFRKIWINRINAVSRLNGISYSKLINKFKKSNIDLRLQQSGQNACSQISAHGILFMNKVKSSHPSGITSSLCRSCKIISGTTLSKSLSDTKCLDFTITIVTITPTELKKCSN